jgi:WD40 repeat protein
MAKQSLSFALEQRASVAFDDYVAHCAWSPDGRRVAVAGGEGKVALARIDFSHDAAGALTLEVLGEHLLGTLAVAWRPLANTFATSGQDGAIVLWDGESGKSVKRWKPAPTPTQALVFSPNGELLASAAGKAVTLWSGEGQKIHAFAPAVSTAVALAFDKPGTDIGVALNGEISVHRVEKSRYETRRYKWPAACLTVNFSGNGRFLASGLADGSLHFWNRSSGKDSQMRGYDGRLELVGWSDNSRYLASSAGTELVLWDFGGKGPEGTKPIVLNGHTERVDSFAWQPGGEHLVSGGRDWRIALWRPSKTREAIDVQMLDSEVTALRWSPDGKFLVAGEKKGRLTVYQLVAR